MVERGYLRDLAEVLSGYAKSLPANVHKLDDVTNGEEPWVLQFACTRELVRRIERDFLRLRRRAVKLASAWRQAPIKSTLLNSMSSILSQAESFLL